MNVATPLAPSKELVQPSAITIISEEFGFRHHGIDKGHLRGLVQAVRNADGGRLDPQTHERLIESTRDLMMSNSTRGFEALAEEFAMSADKIDPATVADALTESGIKFTAIKAGGYLLDLTEQGYGQMTFKQAVQLGYIKLSKA